MDDTQRQLDEMREEINTLKRFIAEHAHVGTMDQRIDISDLVGTMSVVDAAPTHTPRDFSEQFAIYKNSTTYRFYWHDGVAWRYVQQA